MALATSTRALWLLLGFAPLAPAGRLELEIRPARLSTRGGALVLRLPVRSAPRPPSSGSYWLGLSFGAQRRLPAAPRERGPSFELCVDVPRLAKLFSPAPQAGDELLVVAYAGDRPLAGPRALPITATAPRHAPSRCAARATRFPDDRTLLRFDGARTASGTSILHELVRGTSWTRP